MKDWRDFGEVWSVWGMIASRGATATYSSDAQAESGIARSFVEFEKEYREIYEPDYEEFRTEQVILVAALEKIQANVRTARTALAPAISKQLQGLAVVTIPEFRGDRLVLDPRPYIPDIATACAYAIALLLDSTRPLGDKRCFGDRLRRCAYGLSEAVAEPCVKWFLSFAAADGGPMPKYCSPVCRLKAVADTGAARVSKHRKAARKPK
jgi:hypothetical protein